MSRKTWKINQSQRDPKWLVVLGPYDEGFVNAIKTRIPLSGRKWHEGIRAWKVHVDYRNTLELLIEMYSDKPEDEST